jgi:sulfopyruvate decarboxylase subunit beta
VLTKDQLLKPISLHRKDAVVITTMGVVRPWGNYSQSELDFASADSAMGHAADLALGIALAQPRRKVICLNGDGSMLMTLGTLVTIIHSGARNLILFVIQNDTYEITGNQPVPGASLTDYVTLARGAGFTKAHSFSRAEEYSACLPELLCEEGPVFISVRVGPGFEKPLSRGENEKVMYLRPSLAESAHRLRQVLSA